MSKFNLHEMFEKQSDDLVNLFHEFDGDRNTEFIKKHIEIWDDVYDIMEDSRYHRAMKSIVKAGYTAALSDLQGKFDGLLKALEFYANEDGFIVVDYFTESEPGIVAQKALAEFAANAVSKNGEVEK